MEGYCKNMKKWYNYEMKRTVRHMVMAISATLLLASCGGGTTDTLKPTISPLAVRWTVQLMQGGNYFVSIRSSSLLGVYLTEFLLRQTAFRSALAGIGVQVQLLNQQGTPDEEGFALLETLGSILQVDVPDMLNRSPDRIDAFDTYLSNLEALGGRTSAYVTSLEEQRDILMDERSDIRVTASRAQSMLNRALRDQDYATASEQQRILIEARTDLAEKDAQIDELRSTIRIFDDLLEVAEERITVMTSNREALLAGITVVDVPGVEDFGLIEQGSRRSGRSIFDPSGR